MARKKMMDFIALRDHSEKELRQKLSRRFEPKEIEEAITYGREHGWIPDTEKRIGALAEQMARPLHRKKKGIHMINQYLAEKGLPPVAKDPELELEKARELLENKYPDLASSDRALKGKATRFLLSRGFEMSLILNLVLNKGKRNHE